MAGLIAAKEELANQLVSGVAVSDLGHIQPGNWEVNTVTRLDGNKPFTCELGLISSSIIIFYEKPKRPASCENREPLVEFSC